MALAKGFLQATVVVLWAVYAVSVILTSAGDVRADPTGGAGLLAGYLAGLPLGTLGAATAGMLVAVVGLELVFVGIRRWGAG